MVGGSGLGSNAQITIYHVFEMILTGPAERRRALRPKTLMLGDGGNIVAKIGIDKAWTLTSYGMTWLVVAFFISEGDESGIARRITGSLAVAIKAFLICRKRIGIGLNAYSTFPGLVFSGSIASVMQQFGSSLSSCIAIFLAEVVCAEPCCTAR